MKKKLFPIFKLGFFVLVKIIINSSLLYNLLMKGKQKTINILKQKILDMKNELNQVNNFPTFRKTESSSIKKSPSPIRKQPMNYYKHQKIPSIYRCSSFVNSSSPAAIKNIQRSIQKQKSQNVLSHHQTNTSTVSTSKPPINYSNHSKSKQTLKTNIRKTPIKNKELSKSIEKIDSRFYISSQQNSIYYPQKENASRQKELKINNSVSSFEYCDKVEKKRTYIMKKTDPIINPQQTPISKKKMVKQTNPLNSKLFYQLHPNSNLNLHIFGQKQIILQRKGKVSKQKNRSSIEMFSYQQQPQPSAQRYNNNTKNKKLFNQYYANNYSTLLN